MKKICVIVAALVLAAAARASEPLRIWFDVPTWSGGKAIWTGGTDNEWESKSKSYKYTAKSLDDIIPFGKYKGKSIKAVLDKDWRYINWLNTKNIVYYSHDVECELRDAIYLIKNYHWPNPDYFDTKRPCT